MSDQARLIRRDGALIAEVAGLEVARIVGVGTTSPTLEVRSRRGRWQEYASIDGDASHLVEYEELALWIRAQVLRQVEKAGCPHGCQNCAPFRQRLAEIRGRG